MSVQDKHKIFLRYFSNHFSYSIVLRVRFPFDFVMCRAEKMMYLFDFEMSAAINFWI